MSKFNFFGLFMAILVVFAACKEDPKVTPQDPTDPNLIASAKTSDDQFEIRILSESNFLIGYSQFDIQVIASPTGSGASLEELSFIPMMQMPTMMHSTFSEVLTQNLPIGNSEFGVAYQMPTDSGMSWALDVSFKPTGLSNYEISIPIDVNSADYLNIGNFQSKVDSSLMFLSIANLKDYKVGANDLDIVVFAKNSMLNWPGVEDLVINFIPTMPSMGHGSPNNIDPINIGGGHYLGQVNFTMTGVWRLDFAILDGTTPLGECFIELDLE